MEKIGLITKRKIKRIYSKKNKVKFFHKNKNNNSYDNTNIKKIDNNVNKVKIRNPGIDLVRIFSMYAIIIHHILFRGNLCNKYNQYKELILMNISTFWLVSSYALISGYVGYKTNKYSNLLYLLICTLFYSSSITYYLNKFKPQIHTRKLKYLDFFPVIFEAYWYFTEYFGMYLFLPVINKGIEGLNKIELRKVFFSLILIFVIVKDYLNPKSDPFKMNSGYSIIWLLICFLGGAYLGKFKHNFYGIKKIILCLACIFIFYFSTYLCFKLTIYSINDSEGYFKAKVMNILKSLFVMRISSIPMILQSFSVLLLLLEIKYNKYLAKIITFIAPLTFGTYLIHYHPIVKTTILSYLFRKDSNYLPVKIVIKLVLFRGVKIFIICLIIDYLRHILFTFIRIKKICIFIEKKFL